MSNQTLCLNAPTAATATKNEFKALKMAISICKDMLSVSRQRQDLARLSNAQLHDIGLTRSQAQTESERPFWDLT